MLKKLLLFLVSFIFISSGFGYFYCYFFEDFETVTQNELQLGIIDGNDYSLHTYNNYYDGKTIRKCLDSAFLFFSSTRKPVFQSENNNSFLKFESSRNSPAGIFMKELPFIVNESVHISYNFFFPYKTQSSIPFTLFCDSLDKGTRTVQVDYSGGKIIVYLRKTPRNSLSVEAIFEKRNLENRWHRLSLKMRNEYIHFSINGISFFSCEISGRFKLPSLWFGQESIEGKESFFFFVDNFTIYFNI